MVTLGPAAPHPTNWSETRALVSRALGEQQCGANGASQAAATALQ